MNYRYYKRIISDSGIKMSIGSVLPAHGNWSGIRVSSNTSDDELYIPIIKQNKAFLSGILG
jgi:hypothetical protein